MNAQQPGAGHNLSSGSLTLFERSWQVYHQVVADDLMEHGALFEAIEAHLGRFLAEWGDAPLAMADLACGDLTTLAPLLARLPLTSFTGLDACGSVLDRARARLADLLLPCDWVENDLLSWSESSGDRFGLISCLFGLHHLADTDKQRFLEVVAARLAPGGLLLIADVFREPGEARPDYVQRYIRRIRSTWHSLPPHLQDHVIDHLSGSDFPVERDRFTVMAERAGWQAHWIWNGSQRAEALIALRRP